MRRLLFAILILGFVAPLSAQDISVRLRSDSTRILIGDWFPAQLTVEAPKNYRVILPEKDDAFHKAAFVMADSAMGEPQGNKIIYSRSYTLTSFDTNSVEISVDVTYFKPGDTTSYTATSNEISMDVATVRIDTSGSFKDIKEVLDVPYSWWDYVLFISTALAAFLLGWFGWYRWKYRPEKETVFVEAPPEPKIPPEDLALEKLRDLEARKVWEQGMHKQYQSELSLTLREYIEGKFEFPAMEETTGEIIGQIALKGVDTRMIQEVELALKCADLTKFAKYKPDPVAHRQGMKTAYMFVEETKDYQASLEEEVRQVRSTSYMPPAATPRPGEPPAQPPAELTPEPPAELPVEPTPEPPTDTERSEDDVRS